MKTSIISKLIIGGSLVSIGLIGCVVCYNLGYVQDEVAFNNQVTKTLSQVFTDADVSLNIQTNISAKSQQAKQITGNFTDLKINVAASSVSVEASDTTEVYSNYLEDLDISIDDDTLTIETKNKKFNFGNDAYITLYLAQDILDEYELNIGDADFLQQDSLTVQELKANVGMGTATINNITVTDGCEINVGMGVLQASGDFLGDLEIDCGDGDVDIKTNQPIELYGYEFSGGIGNITYGDKDFGGLSTKISENPDNQNVFEIKVGMGDVTVEFEQK